MIEGGQRVFDIAYECGALAVFVSGAGPTSLALVDAQNAAFGDRAAALLQAQRETRAFELVKLRPDNQGATVRVCE